MLLFHGQPGICRFCGCNGDTCRLLDGELCQWMDFYRDTCTAPICIRERDRRRKESEAELQTSRDELAARRDGVYQKKQVRKVAAAARASEKKRA